MNSRTVVICIAICSLVAPACDTGKGAKKAPDETLMTGEEGILYTDGTGHLYLSVDEKAFDAYSDAAVAKDMIGINELIRSGRLIPIIEGTHILVLDIGFFKTKVRVLEGRHKGEAGWVPDEWVKKRLPDEPVSRRTRP